MSQPEHKKIREFLTTEPVESAAFVLGAIKFIWAGWALTTGVVRGTFNFQSVQGSAAVFITACLCVLGYLQMRAALRSWQRWQAVLATAAIPLWVFVFARLVLSNPWSSTTALLITLVAVNLWLVQRSVLTLRRRRDTRLRVTEHLQAEQ